jgi:YHS domain-containing protein
MLRYVVILLVSVLLISLVRSIVGIVLKGFADMVAQPSQAQSKPNAQNSIPNTGELKKDPVCGTFVATSSSVKKTIGGQVIHFCSVDCRDKYKV